MTANLRYTRAILKGAIDDYIRRMYLKHMLWPSLAVVALLGYTLLQGSRWTQTFAVFVVVLIPATVILGHRMRTRQSLKVLDLLDEGQATIQLNEEGVTFESAIGRSHLKWHVFTELWEFPERYLLLYTNSQFMTLPKDQVSEEFVDFIRQRLPATKSKS